MSEELRPWHVTAIHEAGHAVVAAELGRLPERLQLWIRDHGEAWAFGGCVTFPEPREPDEGQRWDPAMCRDVLCIVAAGREAVLSLDPSHIDADPRDADEISIWLDRVEPHPKRRRRVLAQERARARSILEARWPKVGRLASASIERLEAAAKRDGWPTEVEISADDLAAIFDDDGSSQGHQT